MESKRESTRFHYQERRIKKKNGTGGKGHPYDEYLLTLEEKHKKYNPFRENLNLF